MTHTAAAIWLWCAESLQCSFLSLGTVRQIYLPSLGKGTQSISDLPQHHQWLASIGPLLALG
jgi:hypothetical protein